jgi:hypothetical protein
MASKRTGLFVDELVALVSARKPTNHLELLRKIKEDLLKEAKKGHTHGNIYFPDFIGNVREIRVELELMLGLRVERLGLSSDGTALMGKVTWGAEAPPKRRKVLTGNLILACGVCTSSGPVQRLHPCGHLLGTCCVSEAAGWKCPFCREEVSLAQTVFQP